MLNKSIFLTINCGVFVKILRIGNRHLWCIPILIFETNVKHQTDKWDERDMKYGHVEKSYYILLRWKRGKYLDVCVWGERMRDKAGYEVEEIDPSNKGKELHWKWKWITRISYFKTVSRNVAVTPYFILENRQRDDNKNATITPFRYTAFFLFF